jgi:hypothetical protein
MSVLAIATVVALTSTPAAHASPEEDPGLRAYPGRDQVLRLKGDVTDQPVLIDVTGEAKLQSQIDSVARALSRGPVPDGGLKWDPDRRVLVVALAGNVNGTSSDVERAKSSVLAVSKGLNVEFRSVRYSRTELEQLASWLFSTMDEWAPGLTGAGGGFDQDANRVVVSVRLDTGHASAWAERVRALNDDRITVKYFMPRGGPWLENRLDDFAPWTGGAWLHFSSTVDATTSNAWCTLGFTWRKWSNNALYGGTANHCTDEGAYTRFYNDKVFVGLPILTSPASDSMLLGGSSYSATVFVGSQSTNDIRLVKAVDTSWNVNDLVAFSGARSGLVTARVQRTGYLDPCIGLHLTLMDQHVTTGGDSGGPWLTTMSGSGDVVAHGQHIGRSCEYGGSVFMPLQTISAKLSSSLALA